METLAIVLLTSVALTLGAMSPGPEFYRGGENGVGQLAHRRFAAALGMGIGGLLFQSPHCWD